MTSLIDFEKERADKLEIQNLKSALKDISYLVNSYPLMSRLLEEPYSIANEEDTVIYRIKGVLETVNYDT